MDANVGDLCPYFFDYISMADNGRSGLTLNAIHQRGDNCSLSLSEVLKLQHTLFTLWLDKLKLLNQDTLIDRHLLAIPDKLWDASYARPILYARVMWAHVGSYFGTWAVQWSKGQRVVGITLQTWTCIMDYWTVWIAFVPAEVFPRH